MYILTIGILLLITHQSECAMKATAVLYGANSMTPYGTLTINQDNANVPVHITGTLSGLNASSAHGFHVHVFNVSDGSPDCGAAGGHFNPYNAPHGSPSADITHRHVGDLGNITTDASGTAVIDMQDPIIQLYNATQSILNRTVVVHLLRDDGGLAGTNDSITTGSAGARILCGLIKLSQNSGGFMKPTIFIIYITMIVGYIIRY